MVSPSFLLEPMPVNTTAQERRLALVVGINTYRYQKRGEHFLGSLRYAERDAEEIEKLLTQLGFEVRTLLGPQATYASITTAFSELTQLDGAHTHPDSCFVFHFSGHGQLDPQRDDTAYLVLHDTDPSHPAAAGLEMAKLVYNFLPIVGVPNALVLLDSCHSGFAAGVKTPLRLPGQRFHNIVGQLWAGARGRMVLAACVGDALAREDVNLQHGIFTNYVLRHWRDLDGYHPPDHISFSSLLDYVAHKMRQNHPQLSPPTWSGVGAGPTLILRHIGP